MSYPCKCGSKKTSVVDTRPKQNFVIRRRECGKCGTRFSTQEDRVPDGRVHVWNIGDHVQTKSQDVRWCGEVVGTFMLNRKKCYIVASLKEKGSVQWFPERKLTEWPEGARWDNRPPQDNRIEWNEEMVSALVDARRRGCSYLDCADIVGVSDKTIARKCRELGLGGKLNHGTRKGVNVMQTQDNDHG